MHELNENQVPCFHRKLWNYYNHLETRYLTLQSTHGNEDQQWWIPNECQMNF